MSCYKCENLFDQNCGAGECVDQRRRNRTALFDYMVCIQMEEQFYNLIKGTQEKES